MGLEGAHGCPATCRYALASSELKGGTFIVAGHTDAKGGDTYNQGLSERRADAVKRFLAEKYGIEPANLLTVGYGKSRLKNAADPMSGDNRRVELCQRPRVRRSDGIENCSNRASNDDKAHDGWLLLPPCLLPFDDNLLLDQVWSTIWLVMLHES
jgi:hypothetical protein